MLRVKPATQEYADTPHTTTPGIKITCGLI
jgi:hypothetical protein